MVAFFPSRGERSGRVRRGRFSVCGSRICHIPYAYMKALVTGATGFVGSALVKRLVKDGFQVRCLVRNADKAEKISLPGTEPVRGDLSDIASLRGICDGCDRVFHAGAKVSDWGKRSEFIKTNVEATRFLLEESQEASVKRFVFISSSTVVWRANPFRPHTLDDIDESHPYPEKHTDFYNESKAEAERIVLEFNDTGMETVAIRPSNVWGAGDTVILPKIARAAREGKIFSIGGGPKTVMPCHVENLIHAVMLAADSKNAPGRVYFINDEKKIRYLDFISDELAAAGIDWSPGRFSLPYFPVYAAAWLLEKFFPETDESHPPVTRFMVGALSGTRTYKTDRARGEIGYEPVVDYKTGMRGLADWVRENGGEKRLLSLA